MTIPAWNEEYKKRYEQGLFPKCFQPPLPFYDNCVGFREESRKCVACYKEYRLLDLGGG